MVFRFLEISLGLIFLYLLFKIWNIFGFWTLLFTGLLNLISTVFLGHFIGSKSKKQQVIIYNPKEWPKFLNILISLIVGYYLYSVLNLKIISSYDYNFGIAYLLLLTLAPIFFAIYKLIRDRNDFISISATNLKYKDNSETGDFKFADIAEVELMEGIKLIFNDCKTFTIKTSQMNFNSKDLINVFNDIKGKLHEEKKGEA